MDAKRQLIERFAKALRFREIEVLEATLWLDPIPKNLRRMAVESLAAGDAEGLLGLASNEYGLLRLIFRNLPCLRDRGLYERALVRAFTSIRTNHHGCPVDMLRCFFDIADRARLMAAGDPLPGDGPFTVYRGVAGMGRVRRIRGLSWTASQERARWFAQRFASVFRNPAVYRVVVEKRDILFYFNQREEEEFVVMLPEGVRPVLVERITVVPPDPSTRHFAMQFLKKE